MVAWWIGGEAGGVLRASSNAKRSPNRATLVLFPNCSLLLALLLAVFVDRLFQLRLLSPALSSASVSPSPFVVFRVTGCRGLGTGACAQG